MENFQEIFKITHGDSTLFIRLQPKVRNLNFSDLIKKDLNGYILKIKYKIEKKKNQQEMCKATDQKKIVVATKHLKSFENQSCAIESISGAFYRKFGTAKGTKDFFLKHSNVFRLSVRNNCTFISVKETKTEEERKIELASNTIRENNGGCKLGYLSTVFKKEFGTAKNLGAFFSRNNHIFTMFPNGKGSYFITLK